MPGVLPDWKIAELAVEKKMIEPFEPKAVREVSAEILVPSLKGDDSVAALPSYGLKKKKVISYGLSGYGYDLRCADEFKVFTNTMTGAIVDPKNFNEDCFMEKHGDYCIIPPNSFALARSLEYFRIPRDVLAIVLGKSTYARCGIVVNCTPAEPEWEGTLTIEISNTTPLPAKIWSGEGIAQMIFFEGAGVCKTSYKEKNAGQPGKYDKQKAEITLPRM